MPRNQTIRVNLTTAEKEAVVDRANSYGLSVSNWARFVLLRALEKGPKRDTTGVPRDMEEGAPPPPEPTDGREKMRKREKK